MSQIEVTRISSLTAVGSFPDQVNVSRMSLYVIMKPGEDSGEDTPQRQGFCYAQRVRRG